MNCGYYEASMCDTMVKAEGNKRFFAKNSDRDPGEPQLLLYCEGTEGLTKPVHPEHRASYDKGQYGFLQKAAREYSFPYRALISSPSWIWGAEMGVNEQGVAIGNEAVFSTSPVDKNGLLGMDILRLALHNSATAKDAVSVITHLITQYGQGGNASYSGHLSYHNSFLIQDGKEAYILETAAQKWALKKVDSFASISNGYTIGTEYQNADEKTGKSHPDFSRRHASPLHLLFTKGNQRQHFTTSKLMQAKATWTALRDILISNRGTAGNLEHSMQSICLDAKGLVRSQTTSSMIVENQGKSSLVWLTGSPLPIYHPFIPFTLSNKAFASSPFADIGQSYAFSKQHIVLTEQIKAASPQAKEKVASMARELENTFENLVRKPYAEGDELSLEAACNTCLEMLPEHEKAVREILRTL
ncbi:MAG: C69 family dipeptidase [Sphaerochaetaceae bacterium]